MTTASEPKLTNPEEVQEVISGLKVNKTPGPNGIPNRALSISQSERYPFWASSSKRPSSPITSLRREAHPNDLFT